MCLNIGEPLKRGVRFYKSENLSLLLLLIIAIIIIVIIIIIIVIIIIIMFLLKTVLLFAITTEISTSHLSTFYF